MAMNAKSKKIKSIKGPTGIKTFISYLLQFNMLFKMIQYYYMRVNVWK